MLILTRTSKSDSYSIASSLFSLNSSQQVGVDQVQTISWHRAGGGAGGAGGAGGGGGAGGADGGAGGGELDFQSSTSSSRWTAVARVLGSFLKTQEERELKMIKRGFHGQGGAFGETCWS